MPTVTNVAEILIQGTVATNSGGSKNVWNVFHYRYVSGGTGPLAISAVLTAFVNNAWNIIAAELSSLYIGSASQGRYLDDATAQFVPGPTPASGTVTGARLPSSTTVRLLMRGAQRGKNFRGAKAFGVIAESQQLNDELTAAALALWQNPVAVTLGNALPATGATVYNPFILSRSLSQLKTNPTTIVGSDVAAVLVNKTLGTLRRRKEKTAR